MIQHQKQWFASEPVKAEELSFSFVWWDCCPQDSYLSVNLYSCYWRFCYAACMPVPFSFFIYKHDSKSDLFKYRAKFLQALFPITVSNLLWLFELEQKTLN